MWPGQQPPGGEQNPQDNPYQQPGYQHPNPYQQPGFQQPNPYAQQPQQPQWGAPTVATTAAGGPPKGGGSTKWIAIGAALAVVVAAGVTGFLVLGGDGDDEAGGTSGKASASATASPSEEPTGSGSGSDDNPRGTETLKPTVAGWKVVVNPKWGVAFDVPAEWEVLSPSTSIGFEDEKSEDGSLVVVMSGVAQYQSKWCTSDSNKDGYPENTELAAAGVKGANGAKNTADAARTGAFNWVYGGYAQPDRKSVTLDKKAQPYTTASGVKGSIAWAETSGTPRTGKCATDGKALSFGFRNSADDFVTWNLFGAKGVSKEVPKATVMKILSTVRLNGEPTGS
jgi:hypothetical protein